MKKPLLKVIDLKTYFFTSYGVIKAVDGIDFEICERETLGIVGESGCGKTITGLSIMRLIPKQTGDIIQGKIFFNDMNLVNKTNSEMRRIRGNDIAIIFQEPMTSLNPVYTIGDQIVENIVLHQKKKRKEALQIAIEMLKQVSIPIPERRINEYPHELSGGMRQRAMIAMSLSCNPKLLIADEPTTALDVTIQAQILELLRELRRKIKMSMMFITHDLGVVAEMCNRVAVMYAGKIVEYADVESIFRSPKHPYTVGLIDSIPKLESDQKRLNTIPGTLPEPYSLPKGCNFHPRCKFADNNCMVNEPTLKEISRGHFVSCWNYY